MPAADVPPCSRLRGVLIFEQNGALVSNWLFDCLRAKFSWDMTENGRKYIASKPRIDMHHNIISCYATHLQPHAGTHVVLEVALAAHPGAICCRRHRGGADPGARGAAR